jgi:uncharacterized LabA/DUF88 family protein
MTDRLHILVDYDNLATFSKGKTVEAVLRHVESRVPDGFLVGRTRIEMRLYGGWVNGQTLTKHAQQLSAALQAQFPSTALRNNSAGVLETRFFSANFARSGLSLPSEMLRDTFMRNRSVRNVYIDQGAWTQCASPTQCSLAGIEKFIAARECHQPSCSLALKDLIKQDEQKQVDTLLVADMAELVLKQANDRLAIVSSDADMWPGILLCLSAGASVCHVHTTPGTTTKQNLLANVTAIPRIRSLYKQVSV